MIREKGRGKLSNGRTRSRPKSFKTKESAEDYAKSKGIKSYLLKNLRLDPKAAPKYVIVSEED